MFNLLKLSLILKHSPSLIILSFLGIFSMAIPRFSHNYAEIIEQYPAIKTIILSPIIIYLISSIFVTLYPIIFLTNKHKLLEKWLISKESITIAQAASLLDIRREEAKA